MRAEDWVGLLGRLAVGVAVAVLAILAAPVLELRLHVPAALLAGIAGATLWWLVNRLPATAPPSGWTRLPTGPGARGFRADLRTRQLAARLAHAQPGRAFDASTLASILGEVVERRLTTMGVIAAGEPPTTAEAHLSPVLLSYLRAAEAGEPRALNRRMLHSLLEEIDSL